MSMKGWVVLLGHAAKKPRPSRKVRKLLAQRAPTPPVGPRPNSAVRWRP